MPVDLTLFEHPATGEVVKPIDKPFVIQIGFNKCATQSLTLLFANSGYPSLHCNTIFQNDDNSLALKNPRPQRVIHQNIENGRRPFAGFERMDGFFDMELHEKKRRIENFRKFPAMLESYPNAKFILNVRDKDKWIKSRLVHGKGRFLRKFKRIYDETAEQIEQRWRRDYDEHHQKVRDFFAEHPGHFLEFQIEHDDPQNLVDFFQPEFELDLQYWGHFHKTVVPAESS